MSDRSIHVIGPAAVEDANRVRNPADQLANLSVNGKSATTATTPSPGL